MFKATLAGSVLATASGKGVVIFLNNGTTIEDSSISDNFELISDENDYKLHPFEHKNDQKLKFAIGENKIDYSRHTNKLKSGCKDTLKKIVVFGKS